MTLPEKRALLSSWDEREDLKADIARAERLRELDELIGNYERRREDLRDEADRLMDLIDDCWSEKDRLQHLEDEDRADIMDRKLGITQ
ncbi:hypothetical protein [Henriciella pelagia]|uniref:hypothetical protein n=1 Tax=Henriciella pelagia TaxID=1977912 RepID=UPI0035144275